MAVANSTLVWVDKNKIVYLMTNQDADTTAITMLFAGGASVATAVDVVTDVAAAGVSFGEAAGAALTKAIRSGLDGNGSVAAAAWVQADARALLLLNGAVSIGGINTPRLQCKIVPSTLTAVWVLDANVTAGRPDLRIDPTAATGTAYLHIELVHSLTL